MSVHGSASDRKLTPRVHDLFDDGKQIEDRARQTVDPRYNHHVTGGQSLQKLQQFAPIGSGTAHLFVVNLNATVGPQLLKLRVERLSISADAGIAEAADFGGPLGFGLQVCSGHM